MQVAMIGLIALFCFCAISLIFTDNRQGSRFSQEISKKHQELQPDTFVCMHCAARKPISQLSMEINRMCQMCAEMYERVQEEP